MGAIIDAWKSKDYAQVPAHGLNSAALTDAAHVFLDFLTLPEEDKTAICRTLPGEPDRISHGYMRRVATVDADQEEKMYFHYHPDVEVEFRDAIEHAGPKAEKFMDAARSVWARTRAIAGDAIDEFESEWPNSRERFLPTDKVPDLVIRFLAYQKQGHGEFLAKAHYDRGTFTIALGESAPGLRIGTPPVEVEHKEGEVILMPATSFETDIDPSIKPAWHDVVQRPGAELGNGNARWAIVGFFDIQNSSYASLEKTHTLRN